MKSAICYTCETVVEVVTVERDVAMSSVSLDDSKRIVLARALLCKDCGALCGVTKLLGLPREPD